jgi:type I restriction enzyme S subunit
MSLNLDKSTWKRVAFGDVVRNVNVTIRDPEAAGIDRVLAMEHMDPGELKIQRWGAIEDGTTFTRCVKPGQTVFGKRRAYQRKVAYAEFVAICSGDILTFEADETQMLPEFLPFLVQSNEFFDHALGTSAGSLSPRTNWRDLANFEFHLPTLDEQKRITDLLWALERHCRRLSELDNLLEHAQSAFIDDFLRRAGAEWPVKRLADLTTKISDGVHQRPSYVDSGVPFLTVENLTRGDGIDFKDVRYVSSEDHAAFIKRTQPEFGDVLVSKDGTLGVARVVDTDIDFSIFVSIALLKPVRRLLEPGYLRAYFDSRQFRSILSAKTSGSALKHIHLVDFRGTEIPVPPLELQQEFVAELSVIQAARDRTHGERASLAALRSSLLADIFGSN